MQYPEELSQLIKQIKKLSGVGTRTAERFAFEFLTWTNEELVALGATLAHVKEKLPPCPTCGCMTDAGRCTYCERSKDGASLCLIASQRDVFAIEETKTYRGLYHVVEHLVSPLDGRHPHQIRLDKIEARIKTHAIQELILAFDATLEGDTTALFLKQHFVNQGLAITRLAFGLPMGSSLEHIDGSTLARALQGRLAF
ncbi:MAG: Recombination protein recR [Chlamydiota bacterium]|jgi:recombination protein RecR